MTLTINNLTTGTLTYLSGSVSISASSSYTSTDAQLIPFTLDNNLYNDITAQNVSLSDGVNTFTLSEALNYLDRIFKDYQYRVNLNQNITGAGQTVQLAVVNMGSIIVQIEGTFVATLNFEATVDGTNWFNWYGMDNSTLLIINSETVPSQVLFNTGAIQNFRVNCTAYTSGTAVVSISANQGFSGQVSPFTGTSSNPGAFPVDVSNSTPISIGGNVQITDGVHFASIVNSGLNVSLNGNNNFVKVTDGTGTDITSTGSALDVNLKTSSITLPVSGTFWQSTQPVSLTSLPALSASSAVIGHVINDASSAVIGHVIVDTAPVTHVIVDSGALNSNQSTNIAEINGVAPLMGAGNGGTGSLRVNIASDQVSIPVAATLSAETTKVIGTVNVAASQTIGLAAGSAVIGHVINDASSAVIGHVIVDTAPTTAVTQSGSWSLAANQSVNNAQVNGSTMVTSVTGVQDVMARKRTGSTGLSPNYTANHITSKVTTTVTSSTAYVSAIVIACSGAGTSWTMVVQNKEGTPKILVPSFTLTVPSTGLPVVLQFEEPILMTSGIDIITAGTTAGTVDVYVTYWQ